MKMDKKTITTFEEAVEYLDSTPRFTAKNAMEDTKAFLERLGSPGKGMSVIHVAGTNGKGSVCAYLNSILRAAGRSVALFTSPHLVDIRERFVIDGEMVSKEAFLEAFLRVYELLDWRALETDESFYHPTYFEYLFFMAMLLFEERKPDFCILETGLGGRLDATNALADKALTVITRISLDHVEYLGDTLGKIAGEKAGILCRNTPAVCWDTCPETTAVFEKKARELGAPLYFVSKNDISLLKIKRKAIDFSLHSRYYNTVSLALHTPAIYQMENAALAVRAVEVLDGGKAITAEEIREGVGRCFWAGRMEEALPEVYLDGAHNEDGIRAFLETVGQDGCEGRRTLLFGVVKDKDYLRMTEELVGSGLFCRIAIAHMRTGRAVELETLKKVFHRTQDCAVEVYDNVAEALEQLLQSRQERERIYAAGSLYLVGEIKELLKDDKFRRRAEEVSSQP